MPSILYTNNIIKEIFVFTSALDIAKLIESISTQSFTTPLHTSEASAVIQWLGDLIYYARTTVLMNLIHFYLLCSLMLLAKHLS